MGSNPAGCTIFFAGCPALLALRSAMLAHFVASLLVESRRVYHFRHLSARVYNFRGFFVIYCKMLQKPPDAECPRFINELLKPALDNEDIEVLQLYSGQCLLADNLIQTFLVITGTAGRKRGSGVSFGPSLRNRQYR